jgi:hypothetical protein
VSRHPVDRLALVVGLPLLILGLTGLADDLDLIEPGTWLPISIAIVVSLAGIARALVRLRGAGE